MEYVGNWDKASNETRLVCRTFCEALIEISTQVEVDSVSDVHTPEAEAAMLAIDQISDPISRRQNRLAVKIDPTIPNQRDVAIEAAPFTIGLSLYRGPNESDQILRLTDSGSSLFFQNDAELEALARTKLDEVGLKFDECVVPLERIRPIGKTWRDRLFGDRVNVDARLLEHAQAAGIPVEQDSVPIIGQSGLTPYLSWITPLGWLGKERLVIVIEEVVWVADLRLTGIRVSKPREYGLTSVVAATALPPYLKLKFAGGEKLVVVNRDKKRAKELLRL